MFNHDSRPRSAHSLATIPQVKADNKKKSHFLIGQVVCFALK